MFEQPHQRARAVEHEGRVLRVRVRGLLDEPERRQEEREDGRGEDGRAGQGGIEAVEGSVEGAPSSCHPHARREGKGWWKAPA